MEIKIWLKESSQPIIHEHVTNAYTKGELYCCYCVDGLVYKYPLSNIFRIIETYNK